MSSITSRDIRYYNLALEIAKNSDCRYKHGAVIIRGGNVIATGINKITYNKYTKHYGGHCITIHAEMKAIMNAAQNVRGTTLYSARSKGHKAISTPCGVCTVLMLEAGIYHIVYYNGRELIKEKL